MSHKLRAFLLPRPIVSLVTAVAALSAGVAGAPAARAASFQFDGESVRANGGGAITPSIHIAVNAMANERGLEQLLSTDDSGRPVITALNRSNGAFTIYLGVKDTVSGAPLRILPPGPCRKAECMDRTYINFVALAADGTPLLVQAAVTSPDGRLDPASIHGFVPQPEPPGDFPAPMRVDFRLLTESASPEVSITLTVLGENRPMTLD